MSLVVKVGEKMRRRNSREVGGGGETDPPDMHAGKQLIGLKKKGSRGKIEGGEARSIQGDETEKERGHAFHKNRKAITWGRKENKEEQRHKKRGTTI